MQCKPYNFVLISITYTKKPDEMVYIHNLRIPKARWDIETKESVESLQASKPGIRSSAKTRKTLYEQGGRKF